MPIYQNMSGIEAIVISNNAQSHPNKVRY